MPHSQDTTNTYLDHRNWQVCSYFLINLLFKEMFFKCCEVMSDQVLALNLFIFSITLKVNVNVLPKAQRTLCNILWWHLLAWTFSLPLSPTTLNFKLSEISKHTISWKPLIFYCLSIFQECGWLTTTFIWRTTQTPMIMKRSINVFIIFPFNRSFTSSSKLLLCFF